MLDIVSVIFNTLQVQNGGGRHMIYLTLPQIIEAAKYLQLAEILAIFACGLTKISICLFVIRIPNSKRLVTSLYTLIGALVVVNLAYVMILCLQCRPIELLWNPFLPGSCWDKNIYLISGYLQGGWSSLNICVNKYRTNVEPSAFSIVTDLMCTGLPIVVLWNVQISRQKKVAICALMATGLLYDNSFLIFAYVTDLFPIYSDTACSTARMVLLPLATDTNDPIC